MKPNQCPDLIRRGVRQMRKATYRGDVTAALRWIIVIERQLDIIDRLAGAPLHQRVWRYRDHILAAFKEATAVTETNSQSNLAGGEG